METRVALEAEKGKRVASWSEIKNVLFGLPLLATLTEAKQAG